MSNILQTGLVALSVTFCLALNAEPIMSAGEASVPNGAQQSQERKVTGKVVDEQGVPVIGAGVVEQGTTNGVMTDIDGTFTLNLKSSPSVLEVSLLGYQTQTVSASAGDEINVVLPEDTKLLDEVVVIGYGTVRKSDLTGSLSQVSNESFAEQNVTRIDQALQGRATGVQVQNTSGAPGSDVRIRIRGANSILGDNSPLFVIDGFVGADFNDLNPNDIQSIEVLKDASSTAIYGSRGANGVVLVTTRNGASGKTTVTYNGSVSVSKVIKQYDKLGAGEYAELANAHSVAMGASEIFTQQEIDDYYKNGGFDYLDAIFRTAVSHQHQLSLSGGNNRTKYRISGNYLDNNGIIKKTGYEKFAVRTNFTSDITDKLSVRFNMNGVYAKSQNNSGSYSGASNLLTQALAWAPTTDPYDGAGGYTINDPVGSVKTNPLSLLYDTESLSDRGNVNVMAGAAYEIIDGLKLDFQVGTDFINTNTKYWSGDYASNGKPSASKSSSKATTVQTTTQLSYNKLFGKHSVNAVVAFETQKYKYEYLQGASSVLTFPALKYDNLALAESSTVASSYSMWSLVSGLARVNYSYDNRYLASVSVRRDGSSKFAKDNRFSTFPAVALAWNIANEKFMENVWPVSRMKLRLSWGLTGSQAIDAYSTLSSYTTGSIYSFVQGGQTAGIEIGSPGNPALKWETTEQRDLGLDLGFFNDRLTIEADYFWKTTRDLLMNKSIPEYQGGGSITSNIGSVRNTGFELNITGTVIATKEVNWNSTFNFSSVRNKVIDLGDEEFVTSYSDFTGLNHGIPEFIYKKGEPLGAIYGLKYLGPWKASEAEEAAKYGQVPGDARYEDVNGDYTFDGSDAQIIGYGMPKYTLGWNNTVTWKNFTFNVFFQGVLGVDKLNYTRILNMSATNDTRAASLAEVKNRYIPGVQEDTYLPAWSPTSDWKEQSSMTVEDASFIRLKNLSVSYDFDVKRVGHFQVTANATNLFTITGYKGIDPEASNLGGSGSDIRQSVDYCAYPNARTFTLGLNITF